LVWLGRATCQTINCWSCAKWERFRWHLADQLGDAKRRVLGVLDKVFPEFAEQIGDPFGATGGRC